MHRAVDVDLGQAEARRIEVEQAQHLQRRARRRSARARRAQNSVHVCRAAKCMHAVSSGGDLRRRCCQAMSSTAPTAFAGVPVAVAGTRSSGSSRSKTRPSARCSSGWDFERAQRLVEVERRRDRPSPGRPAPRSASACGDRRANGPAMFWKAPRVARRGDQPFAVERPVERARPRAGGAAMAGDGAPALAHCRGSSARPARSGSRRRRSRL